MSGKTKKLVLAALLAALTCVATMLIKVPSPLKGYLNLGDCVVLAAGWILSPAYGFLAAGLGSALADIFSGYVIYAPATFVIKGLMALVAYFGFRMLHKKIRNLPARILSGFTAEVLMVLGYFVYASLLLGNGWAAAASIPGNIVQGVFGIIAGLTLLKAAEKSVPAFKCNEI